MDRLKLENVVVIHMILTNKRFEDVQKKIPKDLFDGLINTKKRVIEEDKKIREKMI